MRVLHLSAHLGGGVGRALACLTAPTPGVEHEVLCLEAPRKPRALDRVRAHGVRVDCTPSHAELRARIDAADLVQLEWWNHPALFAALCPAPLPPLRLLVWSHVSGLHAPRIPLGLLRAAGRTVFTSACSFDIAEIASLSGEERVRLGVCSSAAGVEDLPAPRIDAEAPLRAAYLGSLNPSKLHPEFVELMAAVALPGFRVHLFGDPEAGAPLLARARALGRPELLVLEGFTEDVPGALADFNTLIYPLHPEHYGTAENALVEAMALGLTPVVIDHPAERVLVEHGVTGLVAADGAALVAAIDELAADPARRAALGQAASVAARTRFTGARMRECMREYYALLMAEPRREIDFAARFGRAPAHWFMACQPPGAPFLADGTIRPGPLAPALFEPTKGSLLHFRDYFPDDSLLARWAGALETRR
ncbi:glycosyltransferase [Marichromatium gracile]|uniref:Glycosyl transferase family 1 n=1 Tax=Marichromatium gracile TaxID=1048 RepID=A0A4R4ABP2_MARGR|nr:glycosyltransferase [Marichromatium gracile]MBK1709322.1 hypothetical protein [Marichromatium gracile]TCW36224.1 glycosyl transferase family 1 [Marichromatium gracile]